MFDGLSKSKFYTKCKSNIKLTMARIDAIKKKGISMQNYLRNGIADLLKTGLDINAYDRAEELLVELNKSNCYEFIHQSLNILHGFTAMNKQRECPEECREAVSSLVFAAARVADLPELRELRTLFSERYGNSVDIYVNKQFVEKMKSGLPSKDAKLQLLQEIASAYGLKWDSKDLKNKLYREAGNEKNFELKSNGYKFNLQDSINVSVQKKDCGSTEDDADKNSRENIALNTSKSLLNNRHNETTNVEERFLKKHDRDSAHPRDGKVSRMVKKPDEVPSVQNIQVDMVSRNLKVNEKKIEKMASVVDENKHKPQILKAEDSEIAPLSYRSIPPCVKAEFSEKNSHLTENEYPVRGKGKTADRGKNSDQGSSVGKAKPVPKSVRTRLLKPPLPQESVNSESEKRDHPAENKDKAGEGRRILKFLDEGWHSQQDDERMVDDLLLHYCSKKGPYKTSKPDSVIVHADSSSALNRGNVRLNRIASLPCEITNPTETSNTHTRTSSFDPAMYNANLHLHPKLPDYDDFVARLASLRGR